MFLPHIRMDQHGHSIVDEIELKMMAPGGGTKADEAFQISPVGGQGVGRYLSNVSLIVEKLLARLT